jgi:hypothetical protein
VTPAPKPESAADVLRPLIYGNLPLEQWGSEEVDDANEPWASFYLARSLFHQGDTAEAVEIWQEIASTSGLEARQVLQAWHFLRLAGHLPPPEVAKQALGVVAEVPVTGGHDLLAAYRDGSARYLNHAGGASIVEEGSLPGSEDAIKAWLAVGQALAASTGPWDQPDFPPLPPGQLRVMVLTPSGPHFGQGPYEALAADARVQAFMNAAGALLQVIVQAADGA